MRRPDPERGRGVVLAMGAGGAALVSGVLIASTTVGAMDPFYRFGPEPRRPRAVRVEPAPEDADAFIPVRWSGFAAAPPAGDDLYDDPALLAEPQPSAPTPEAELSPPEPVDAPPPEPDALVAEPSDLPPAVAPAGIAEAPPRP